MYRRHLIISACCLVAGCAQSPTKFSVPATSTSNAPIPIDFVAVYVIPTDHVSEEAAAQIARSLTKATGLWIKATLWTPPGNIEPISGTNQYPAEKYIQLGAQAARTLPEASPRTYCIVLTDRDINSGNGNFRFQFSMHNPALNSSVLSIARLQYNSDGRIAAPDVAQLRAQKLLLRIIGEMRLGWKRTSDPHDVMYAPLMSIDDIDRMRVSHTADRADTQ